MKLFFKILLLKSGAFRKWYKNKLSTDLHDLELDENFLSRKEIFDKKLKIYKGIK